MEAHQSSKTERLPQKLLAAEVTELVHGPAALSRALTAAQVLYSTSISSLTAEKVLDAFRGDMRLHRVKKEDLAKMGVGKVAVTYGLCGSVGKYFFIFTRNMVLIREIGESQRLVQSSALQVNDRKIGDHREKIAVEDLVDGHIAIVRAGHKRQIILYVE